MVDLVQTVEVDLGSMDADQLLDCLIEVRTGLARLKEADEILLDRLSVLAEAGEVDQGGFSHRDWQITWSAGRKSWTYPAGVQELEAKTKEAKAAAQADNTATAKVGEPFWTIKPPKP
jgi:hypothetical protein